MNNSEMFIQECEKYISEYVEVLCPEVKLTIKVLDNPNETECHTVLMRGKVEDYPAFEQEYCFESTERFRRMLPIFIIQVYQVYYHATKCGGFCKNAEICKFRPEA